MVPRHCYRLFRYTRQKNRTTRNTCAAFRSASIHPILSSVRLKSMSPTLCSPKKNIQARLESSCGPRNQL